jgi:hypothetical protein
MRIEYKVNYFMILSIFFCEIMRFFCAFYALMLPDEFEEGNILKKIGCKRKPKF